MVDVDTSDWFLDQGSHALVLWEVFRTFVPGDYSTPEPGGPALITFYQHFLTALSKSYKLSGAAASKPAPSHSQRSPLRTPPTPPPKPSWAQVAASSVPLSPFRPTPVVSSSRTTSAHTGRQSPLFSTVPSSQHTPLPDAKLLYLEFIGLETRLPQLTKAVLAAMIRDRPTLLGILAALGFKHPDYHTFEFARIHTKGARLGFLLGFTQFHHRARYLRNKRHILQDLPGISVNSFDMEAAQARPSPDAVSANLADLYKGFTSASTPAATTSQPDQTQEQEHDDQGTGKTAAGGGGPPPPLVVPPHTPTLALILRPSTPKRQSPGLPASSSSSADPDSMEVVKKARVSFSDLSSPRDPSSLPATGEEGSALA